MMKYTMNGGGGKLHVQICTFSIHACQYSPHGHLEEEYCSAVPRPLGDKSFLESQRLGDAMKCKNKWRKPVKLLGEGIFREEGLIGVALIAINEDERVV
jgi:hypothetical protein